MKRLLLERLLIALVVMVLSLGLVARAMAGTGTDTQNVIITFSEIAEIAASGDVTITIAAPATPGDLPADVSDTSTTMAWTSNVGAATTRKITGALDVLFSGVDLYATVDAAGSADGTAASETKFAAATTAYDFVTAIGNSNQSGKQITIRTNVTSMVAPYTSTSQAITWTLTEDA